jgi:putative ABC transport system permease protein
MNSGEKQFVITGTYRSLDNLGEGMRFGGKTVLDRQSLVSLMPINVDVLGDIDNKEAIQLMKEIFPTYTVQSAAEFKDRFLGVMLDQINLVVGLAVILVVSIIILVTVLIAKGLLYREHGDAAILKCLGFTEITLKKWQTYRILVISAAAAVLGCILSVVLLPVTIKPLFTMMGGANIRMIVHPLESFVICPLVLLVISGVSAYLAVRELKNIACKEI